MVLCFNGKDHFTPTKPSSESKFYSWKLNKELGPIVSASLLVIEELDKHKPGSSCSHSYQSAGRHNMSNLACNFTNIIVLSPEGSCCVEQGRPSAQGACASAKWTLPPHLQIRFPFQMQINLKHQRNHQLEGRVPKNIFVIFVVL